MAKMGLIGQEQGKVKGYLPSKAIPYNEYAEDPTEILQDENEAYNFNYDNNNGSSTDTLTEDTIITHVSMWVRVSNAYSETVSVSVKGQIFNLSGTCQAGESTSNNISIPIPNWLLKSGEEIIITCTGAGGGTGRGSAMVTGYLPRTN